MVAFAVDGRNPDAKKFWMALTTSSPTTSQEALKKSETHGRAEGTGTIPEESAVLSSLGQQALTLIESFRGRISKSTYLQRLQQRFPAQMGERLTHTSGLQPRLEPAGRSLGVLLDSFGTWPEKSQIKQARFKKAFLQLVGVELQEISPEFNSLLICVEGVDSNQDNAAITVRAMIGKIVPIRAELCNERAQRREKVGGRVIKWREQREGDSLKGHKGVRV
ncbi:hypothetical protein F2Q68_00005434 [Brassica cretica]|uniref:Uncharacterized protein n=1 Tax=Brassica cretica TaxID=69181 RepID=A0A8S9JHT7_BRACR|nr:hypothetical protein F2Q68_00005434 [Brassica cretica]